jgi:hypothetical protein
VEIYVIETNVFAQSFAYSSAAIAGNSPETFRQVEFLLNGLVRALFDRAFDDQCCKFECILQVQPSLNGFHRRKDGMWDGEV